jgi:hypothetical protein
VWEELGICSLCAAFARGVVGLGVYRKDGKEDGAHKELVGVENAEEEEPSETDDDKEGDPDYSPESLSSSEDEE